MPSNEIILVWLLIGTFSAWGGFVRYIIDNKSRNSDWNWGEVLEQIIISSFSGFLGGFIFFESGVGLYTTFALSGLFGTMGNSGIDYLRKRFFNHGDRK